MTALRDDGKAPALATGCRIIARRNPYESSVYVEIPTFLSSY
jgi:hypothetical protein